MGPGRMVKNKTIIVLGAGGHAKVVIATAHAAGFRVSRLYDDNPAMIGRTVLGVPVVGPCSDVHAMDVLGAVLAIGNNATRRRFAQALVGLPWATLIHPMTSVHETARLGAGTVVFAGSVIQPDAELGAHVIINTGASVDHDCRVGDYAHVAPGARLAGNVSLGTGSLAGIGSCAVPNSTIGSWSVIGAGSAVIDAIPDGVVAAGVPARVLKRLEDR